MSEKSTSTIREIVVLGGGSAGFLTALSIRRKNPDIAIRIVRSPSIGIIGVGESTIQTIPKFLHGYLGINPAQFHAAVKPTWKLAIRFLWGKRDRFHYSFRPQATARYEFLPRAMGFYYEDEFEYGELASSLCAQDRMVARNDVGQPVLGQDLAYHLENETFVLYLEQLARTVGIEIIDDTVTEIGQDEGGISHLQLAEHGRISAGLYLDCSGFRSLLLGDTLKEPFESFESSLFCDRAVIGAWDRGSDEVIKPYTLAETMDAGWCWRIDHDLRTSRGYVYASSFLSDAEAEEEFRRKNNSVEETRVIRFRTGQYRRKWVKNVIAVGNSGGFVEPLESTALHVIGSDAKAIAETLRECGGQLPGPSIQAAYNQRSHRLWISIREFLSVHYKFNNRLDTPFWESARADVDVGGAAAVIQYYRENGPSDLYQATLVDPLDPFHVEGYFTLLLGMNVPFQRLHEPSEQELMLARQVKDAHEKIARGGMTVNETLPILRAPSWQWNPELFRLG